jgi:lipoate-protein ligase A
MICGWIVNGLKTLGIDAVFNPVNDVLVGGKKISGSAQTRRGGILLQHGTVLFDLDLATMFSVLNISKQKISDKMIQSAEERVTSIIKQIDIDKKDVYDALLRSFTEDKDFKYGAWNMKEMIRAKVLALKKYKTDKWMFLR